MKKRICSILTALSLCLSLGAVPGRARYIPYTQTTEQQHTDRVEEAPVESRTGKVHTLTDMDMQDLDKTLERSDIQDGDTIIINGTAHINDKQSNSAPWVINKRLTIRGGQKGSIDLRPGGILLNADVTFENLELSLANNVRNVIMANGHTLILDNVSKSSTGRPIHVMCGGVSGLNHVVSKPGTHSQVTIKGNAELGNIYAGSIASNDQGNSFDHPVTITIDQSATGRIDNIYSSGALETYVSNDHLLDPHYQVAPPTPSPDKYKVTGPVEIQLYQNVVRMLDGKTGGSKNADVIYTGDGNLNNTLPLANIASLSVKSGDICPAAGSSFVGTPTLSVAPGATLNLKNFGNALEVGQFNGSDGGTVILGENQTMTVQGTVSGQTKVGIGSLFNNASQGQPIKGHTYIKAAQSVENSFTLIPPNHQTALKFAKDSQGNWTIPGASGTVTIKIDQISIPEQTVDTADTLDYELPVQVTYSDDTTGTLNQIRMAASIVSDGKTYSAAQEGDEQGGYRYPLSQGNISSLEFVMYDGGVEALSVSGSEADGKILPGEYLIKFTISPKYMVNGQLYTLQTKLTVTGGDTSTPDPVPQPSDLKDAVVTVDGAQTYTGSPLEPAVTVTLQGTELQANTDYTVKYSNNTDAGTATVTVTAAGSKYTGSASTTFTIAKAPLTCKEAELAPKTYDGTNAAVVNQVTFYRGDDQSQLVELKQGTDYSASATYNSANVKEAKTANVTVALQGKAASNYTLKSDSLTVPGTIAKATAAATPGQLTVTNHQAMNYSYDLADLLPDLTGSQTYGAKQFTLGTVELGDYYTADSAKIQGSTLTLPIQAVETDVEKQIGTVQVHIETDHYTVADATITVNAVNKQVPQGAPALSTSELVYGQPLSTIQLSGTMTDSAGTAIPGKFTWNTPNEVFSAGTHHADWTFTPEDTAQYLTVTQKVEITVKKATPNGTPKYTSIATSGKTLADAKLTAESNSFNVPGTVKWALSDTTPVQANTAYQWIFTPNDSANYNTLTGNITLYTVSGGNGGGSSGGSSHHSDSKPDITKNPDNSTTETVKKSDGTVIETTKWPDGSSTQVESKKDGTTITTEKDGRGNVTEEIKQPDGSIHTTESRKDGTKVETNTNRYGDTTAKVNVPKAGKEVTVTIPTPGKPAPGEVIVLVKPDGTEEVVRKTVLDVDGLVFSTDETVKVKVEDRGKYFYDIPAGHWTEDAVAFVTARELFNGVSETTFAPNRGMTRGMLAVVLHHLENDPYSFVDGSFQDVPTDSWAGEAIYWAAENGIVSGYGNGSFGINDQITREQLAVMLYRYAGSPKVTNTYLNFTDANQVGGYADSALRWAVDKGIVGGMGDGTLNPKGTATRAQVAAMLMRFVEHAED